MTRRKRGRPHRRRPRAERVRIGREYARAARKGLGVQVLKKYGVTYRQAIDWSRGVSLGIVGVHGEASAPRQPSE